MRPLPTSDSSAETGQLVQLEALGDPEPIVLSSRQKRDRVLAGLFVATVSVAAVYNFLIATPRYASQFSYVVRSSTSSHDRFSFMNFSASGEGSDNSQAIITYLSSRDLIHQINQDGLVTRIFAAPQLDMFSAFPSPVSGKGEEHLFRHFRHYVDAYYDDKSNISYVEVQAFTPSDAQALAERMRRASEDKINTLNTRARAGMTAAAELEVAAARADLARVLADLTHARNHGGVIDPTLQSGAAVKVASGIAEDLAQIDVQIAQTRRAAPGNPGLAQMESRRAAIQAELARQNAAMAGGQGSLANRIEGSEELNVAREAAEKRLLGASLALATARTNADRNRLYLEWISAPNRPDEPLYPRRGRNMALVAALSLALLWIVRSLSELLFDADE